MTSDVASWNRNSETHKLMLRGFNDITHFQHDLYYQTATYLDQLSRGGSWPKKQEVLQATNFDKPA